MMIAVKTFTGIIAVHFILASSVFACGGGGKVKPDRYDDLTRRSQDVLGASRHSDQNNLLYSIDEVQGTEIAKDEIQKIEPRAKLDVGKEVKTFQSLPTDLAVSRLLGLKGLKDVEVAKGHVLADNLKTSRYISNPTEILAELKAKGQSIPKAHGRIVAGDPAELIMISMAGSTGSDCPKVCNKILSPVCGSDGKTYPSKCVLRVKRCSDEGSQDLVVVSKGKCPEKKVDVIGKEKEKLVVKSKRNPFKNSLVVESEIVSAKDLTKIGEVVDEDGGEKGKLVVKSKIDPTKNVLVVKSHIQNVKDSNENGRDVDENGKVKGKLVVNSKINRAKNSLVVESHVDGAKDSNINLGDEKLVVNSKINRAKNSLVVESHVDGANDSNINLGDEKLVVNSKINRAKNSLMVESHVDGAKDSNINLGDEKLVVNSKINRAKNSLVVESHVE